MPTTTSRVTPSGEAMRPRKRLKLAPDFVETLAQAEISIAQLTRESKVSETTIYQLRNPSLHPERKGGMQRTTAWKLANAFARLTQREPKDAYALLIVEETEPPAIDGNDHR